MARSIEDINNSIKELFLSNNSLMSLYNNQIPTFNRVTIESVLLYVISVVSATIETMFDWHKRDITQFVENERYGYTKWYERIAKMFRYGESISDDYSENGSFAETAIYPGDAPDNLDELQIVKHAFASEREDNSGVQLKIATETGSGDNRTITQLTAQQLTAFTAYMNRIKPAGIQLHVVNEPAESININITVWIDPLVLDGRGVHMMTGKKPVEIAINQYLNSIEFNGEFIAMRMIDAIQQVDGVNVINFIKATALAGTNKIQIVERYTPASGYMKLSVLEIEYITEI